MSARTIALLTFFALLVLAWPAQGRAHGAIAPGIPYHHNWIRVGPGCETKGVARPWQASTGNGFYGGLQLSKSTWDSVNRSPYAYPHRAPPWVQIGNANRLKARSGLSPWPHCGSAW